MLLLMIRLNQSNNVNKVNLNIHLNCVVILKYLNHFLLIHNHFLESQKIYTCFQHYQPKLLLITFKDFIYFANSIST